jgi:hypothetical protein
MLRSIKNNLSWHSYDKNLGGKIKIAVFETKQIEAKIEWKFERKKRIIKKAKLKQHKRGTDTLACCTSRETWIFSFFF